MVYLAFINKFHFDFKLKSRTPNIPNRYPVLYPENIFWGYILKIYPNQDDMVSKVQSNYVGFSKERSYQE